MRVAIGPTAAYSIGYTHHVEQETGAECEVRQLEVGTRLSVGIPFDPCLRKKNNRYYLEKQNPEISSSKQNQESTRKTHDTLHTTFGSGDSLVGGYSIRRMLKQEK